MIGVPYQVEGAVSVTVDDRISFLIGELLTRIESLKSIKEKCTTYLKSLKNIEDEFLSRRMPDTEYSRTQWREIERRIEFGIIARDLFTVRR